MLLKLQFDTHREISLLQLLILYKNEILKQPVAVKKFCGNADFLMAEAEIFLVQNCAKK